MAAYLTRSDGEVSNVVDGANMLWNDSEEDGYARSDSEEDEEGTDCEDGDSNTDW